MLWNAASIQNKKPELQTFLYDQQIDIAITETWLAPKDTMNLQDYNIYRKDRILDQGKSPRGKGRENDRRAQQNPFWRDIAQPIITPVETIAIKTKAISALIITAAYVPPSHKITAEELDQITYQNGHAQYITEGDFNAKH